MAAIEINFTKKSIEMLPPPESSRLEAYDTEVKGLMVRVTASGVKTFAVFRRMNGKPKRVTLGRYPDMTIEQARKKARATLNKLSDGVDPVAEKRAERTKGVTLTQVLDDYIAMKQSHADPRKHLKPRTVTDYRSAINETFSDWKNRALSAITENDCITRHAKRSKESKARTDNAFRVLRLLFNFAAWNYRNERDERIFRDNPVRVLTETERWNDVERRKTRVGTADLKAWFAAVNALDNERISGIAETARDYLLTVLFTGLRRTEAASIKKTDVDLNARVLTIPDTKNKVVHTLPLPDFLFELLSCRVESVAGDFLFPGKKGPLTSPDEYVDAVEAACGIRATAHDLRRTFASVAEALNLSEYTIKRLLNHKRKDDVTGGYIVIEVDRLRAPMQAICDFILDKAGVRGASNVVALKVAS